MATNKNTCAVPNCGRNAEKRGWCNMHYKRWMRNGDPEVTRRYLDPTEGIERRTERRGACLVWTGGLSEQGYARIRVSGVKTMAHRFVYEQHHGPIPEGMQIDHKCLNRACLEPSHLRVVTNKQNGENKRGSYSTNKSGFRGVTWDEKSKRWMVRVIHHQKRYYGGSFVDVDAANEAAIALRNSLFTHNELDRAHALHSVAG